MIDYKNKYLKYKNKYLKLKKQLGGAENYTYNHSKSKLKCQYLIDNKFDKNRIIDWMKYFFKVLIDLDMKLPIKINSYSINKNDYFYFPVLISELKDEISKIYKKLCEIKKSDILKNKKIYTTYISKLITYFNNTINKYLEKKKEKKSLKMFSMCKLKNEDITEQKIDRHKLIKQFETEYKSLNLKQDFDININDFKFEIKSDFYKNNEIFETLKSQYILIITQLCDTNINNIDNIIKNFHNYLFILKYINEKLDQIPKLFGSHLQKLNINITNLELFPNINNTKLINLEHNNVNNIIIYIMLLRIRKNLIYIIQNNDKKNIWNELFIQYAQKYSQKQNIFLKDLKCKTNLIVALTKSKNKYTMTAENFNCVFEGFRSRNLMNDIPLSFFSKTNKLKKKELIKKITNFKNYDNYIEIIKIIKDLIDTDGGGTPEMSTNFVTKQNSIAIPIAN